MLKLSDLIIGMESDSDFIECYVNPEEGSLVYVSQDDRFELNRLDEEDELPADLALIFEVTEGYLYRRVPTRYEIDEYGMMEDFIYSLDNTLIKEKLSYAINGKGAFRRFKDTAFDYGIIDRWYEFRDKAYKKVAIEFCRDSEIDFVDDCERGKNVL